MATRWSNYQVTQGYMEWFYDVKFAVVTVIALGFVWYSVSRVIAALKNSPPKTSHGKIEPKQGDDGSDR